MVLVDFPSIDYPKKLGQQANAILSAVSEEEFESIAKQVSHAIWSDDQEKLNSLSKSYQTSSRSY